MSDAGAPRDFGPGFTDPDELGDDDLEPREISVYEALKAEVSRKIERPPITLVVPGRPGWAVRYNPNFESSRLQAWGNASKDRHAPNGIDGVALACRILAGTCEAFVLNGQDALDEETKQPITFTNRQLMATFGQTRAIHMVRAWYASDASLDAASTEVVNAAGYGEEALRAEEDPTQD